MAGEKGEAMNTTNCTTAAYELRFCCLVNEGRALSFPCDASGHVDLDALSERARRNYFYARTVNGREFTLPAVLPSETKISFRLASSVTLTERQR